MQQKLDNYNQTQKIKVKIQREQRTCSIPHLNKQTRQ